MSWTFFQGNWHEGNPKIIGPRSQAMWLASTVFDGARAFEDTTPDLAAHAARCGRSARAMGLNPTKTSEEIQELAIEAVAKYPKGSELYIRPMFWAENGGAVPEPESTEFALCVYDDPLPSAKGFAATLSSIRRPLPDTMVTGAKASCLYPAISRPLAEARHAGFDSVVVLDPWNNLAEFATSNLFLVRDGTVFTPKANESYLNGITRQRIIKLMAEDGITVIETTLSFLDLEQADEAFSSGNHGKIQPLTRLNNKEYPIGKIFQRARQLYWDFAHNDG